MTSPCVRCGAPTDAAICRPEARELADRLLVAAGHAEDAEAVLTRQVRYGAGGRGGSGEEPMPVDLTAAGRLHAIENTVTTWARHVIKTRGVTLPTRRPLHGPLCADRDCEHGSCESLRMRRPPSGLGAAASWLATQTEWLRKRPEAGEAFDDLERACETLARLVDRPADDRHLVGICNCGKVLYAPWNWTVIQCKEKTCGASWNLADGQDILLRHLDDKLVTPGEAAKLAGHLDPDRSQESVRKLVEKWASYGRLAPHGHIMREPTDAEIRKDPEAYPVMVPTYRFGEIRALLDQTPRRNRQGAAA